MPGPAVNPKMNFPLCALCATGGTRSTRSSTSWAAACLSARTESDGPASSLHKTSKSHSFDGERTDGTNKLGERTSCMQACWDSDLVGGSWRPVPTLHLGSQLRRQPLQSPPQFSRRVFEVLPVAVAEGQRISETLCRKLIGVRTPRDRLQAINYGCLAGLAKMTCLRNTPPGPPCLPPVRAGGRGVGGMYFTEGSCWPSLPHDVSSAPTLHVAAWAALCRQPQTGKTAWTTRYRAS